MVEAAKEACFLIVDSALILRSNKTFNTVITRRILSVLVATFLVSVLSACGGGGSSGGNGGGGDGSPPPQISAVSPSTVMERGPIPATDFLFYIYGKNFSQGAQVSVDGQPAATTFLDASTLKAEFVFTVSSVIGTHQLTVTDSSKTSNAAPFTAYWPQSGPLLMQALPSFLVAQESNPNFVAVADVNGDGLADVIMPGDTGTTAILYGKPDGSLAVNTTISGFLPWSLAVGDVDGNGTADLVGTSSDNAVNGTTTVTVMLGDGQGNFQPVTTSQPFPGIYPGPAQLVDLDGDGKLDLVLSIEQSSSGILSLLWLKNEGGGNFAAPVILAKATYSTEFCVADFNGDGKPDILYFYYNPSTNVREVHTLLNKGAGAFKDQLTPGLSGVSISVINTIDFNLDGIPDLVVQTGQNSTVVLDSYKGNGDGSFTKVASQTLTPPDAYEPFNLVVGDFDHDGFSDLAGVDGESEPSHVVYLYGDGTGNFTLQEVVGPDGVLVAAGDLNGDGIPDLVVPEQENFVSVALGRTDRTFVGPLALSPLTAEGISAGDINGDGLPEIFASGDRRLGLSGTVFLNLGNSSFQLAATTDPSSGSLADLTGRGVFDLLGYNGQDLIIWPNNGTLNFTSSPVTVPQVTSITVADVDRDGHPDIVDVGRVLYGNSNYQFTQVATNPTFSPPYAVGDFNGDGALDIGTGTFTFLTTSNRIISTIRVENRLLPIGNGFIPVVADFNGDGYDDVALIGPGLCWNHHLLQLWRWNILSGSSSGCWPADRGNCCWGFRW